MVRVYSADPILFHRFSGVDVVVVGRDQSRGKVIASDHASLLIDIDCAPAIRSMPLDLCTITNRAAHAEAAVRLTSSPRLGPEKHINIGCMIARPDPLGGSESLQKGLKLAQGLGNNVAWRCTLLNRFPDFPIETLRLVRKDNARAVRRLIDEHFKWVAFLLASHRATEH
jgi:hypothetical protein